MSSVPVSNTPRAAPAAATTVIGIGSIHLPKTFISAANYSEKVLRWQTLIHFTFLLSALAIAFTDRLLTMSASDAVTH